MLLYKNHTHDLVSLNFWTLLELECKNNFYPQNFHSFPFFFFYYHQWEQVIVSITGHMATKNLNKKVGKKKTETEKLIVISLIDRWGFKNMMFSNKKKCNKIDCHT